MSNKKFRIIAIAVVLAITAIVTCNKKNQVEQEERERFKLPEHSEIRDTSVLDSMRKDGVNDLTGGD